MTQTFELIFVSAQPLDDPLGRLRGLLADFRACHVARAAGRFRVVATLVLPNASGDVNPRDVHGAVFDAVAAKTRQISLTNVTQVSP